MTKLYFIESDALFSKEQTLTVTQYLQTIDVKIDKIFYNKSENTKPSAKTLSTIFSQNSSLHSIGDEELNSIAKPTSNLNENILIVADTLFLKKALDLLLGNERINFKKSSIICLEYGADKKWGLEWIINSDLLKLIENREESLNLKDKYKEMELDYNAILDNLNDYFYIKDSNYRFRAVNNNFAKLTGHQHWSEIVGKTDFDVFPKSVAQTYRDDDKKIIELGKPVLGRIESYSMDDDTQGWVQTSKQAIYDDNGNAIGIFGFSTDVTELIRTRENSEKLLQGKDRLLELFDKGASVLFKWNNDDVWSVEYVSKNVSDLLGFEIEEFTSNSVVFSECIHKDDLSQVLSEVTTAIENSLDFFKHRPYRVLTKSGEIKWVLDYTVAQKDENGNTTHFIGYITDITEQQNIQKELQKAKHKAEESDKSKSTFLANMSHEIRTPLNAIFGFVNLLKNENKGKDKSLEYINIIESSSKTLFNIIEDILDFSKIESGKLTIDLIDFNIKDELGVLKDLFDAQCSEKNINLLLTFEDNLPEAIKSDPHRIKQVLSNLLSNAIKFTQPHKSIEIAMAFQDNRLKVSVRDEGKGIAQDKLSLIFDAFSQEDSSTTREFGGTGLGLSISNELIRLLGGDKLKVKSELGIGSEFYFDIPVQITASVPIFKEEIENISFIGKKLLIVEDNESNQLFMNILLEELETDSDIANDGIEAIDLFKSNKYDAILMDENMPNMSGIEATKYIVEYEKHKGLTHTPIIALTANAIKGDREKFLDAGMDEYMTKPLERQILIQKLSMFLK